MDITQQEKYKTKLCTDLWEENKVRDFIMWQSSYSQKENYTAIPHFWPTPTSFNAHTIFFFKQCLSEFGPTNADGLMLFFWKCRWISGHLSDSLRQKYCHSNLLVCQDSKAIVSPFTTLPMKNRGSFADDPFCSLSLRQRTVEIIGCSYSCIYTVKHTERCKVNLWLYKIKCTTSLGHIAIVWRRGIYCMLEGQRTIAFLMLLCLMLSWAYSTGSL